MSYLRNYSVKDKKITFPIYLPDATRAIVRSVDSADLAGSGVEGMVINTYHLMTQPGTTVIKALGGVGRFMNWPGLLVSDSGGFQLLSMVYKNAALGKINKDGVIFYVNSQGEKRKYTLTPEKSIRVQFALGSDIVICLDDCPAAKATEEKNLLSVERTIEWAGRCKEEYLRLTKGAKKTPPKLFAVVQGGESAELRTKCAQALIKIGFDGYCFGGWPLDEEKNLRSVVKLVADLLPDDKPKFALGIGNPAAIVAGFKMGYQIFDCVLPTRDARHERLYVFTGDPEKIDILNNPHFYEYVHILKEQYVRDPRPISAYCDCYTCHNYSRAYLHHLFRIEDALAWRLATIHNLRMYTKLIEVLRSSLSDPGSVQVDDPGK